jgi:hypothetical protein
MRSHLHSRKLRLSLLASAPSAWPAGAGLCPGPAGRRPAHGLERHVGGNATITQNGNTLNINQTSQQAMANFATFNVGAGALVDIRQP